MQPAPILQEHSIFAGHYKIGAMLGRGGYGEVYVAEDQRLKRKVALKILLPQRTDDEKALKRFQAEVYAATRLNHRSIALIYDTGRDKNGVFFIAMEYVEGETLAARLMRMAENGRLLGFDKALQIAYQVARCLEKAHAKGVFHRDIKPQNLMLTEDEEAPGGELVKVLDFGIAKLLSGDGDEFEGATSTGDQIPGTYTYMAPEQFGTYKGITGQEGKMDVYALGVMTYRMISGGLPLYDKNPAVMMGLALAKEPRPLQEVAPDAPTSIAELVHRMLAKQPEDRPSMLQVRDRLAHLLGMASSRTQLPAITAKPEPVAEAKPDPVEQKGPGEPKPSTDEVEEAAAATADEPADPVKGNPSATPSTLPVARVQRAEAAHQKGKGDGQRSVGERSTKPQMASADFVAPSTGRPSGQQITGPQAKETQRSGARLLTIGVGALVVAAALGAVGMRSWTHPAPASVPPAQPLPAAPDTTPPPPKAVVAAPAPEAASPMAAAPSADTGPTRINKAKPPCVTPTEGCISETANATQRRAIMTALQEADIKLCASDRLIVTGKPALAVRGNGVKKDKQQHILFALRGSLGNAPFAGEIEIRCKGK